jgi:CO/xanthine dehydrogenase FAD-binding subunit
MKPPPFEYHEASGLADALDLLADHGTDAKVLAGAQSLVPLLNFRIVRPSCLIDKFFAGIFTTALAPDELVTAIEVPLPSSSTGSAFCELVRRHGDFALGGAAVLATVGPGHVCERAAIALLAAAPPPTRAAEAEAWLAGRRLDEAAATEAARLAVTDVDPPGDIHGSPGFRRRVIEELVRRAPPPGRGASGRVSG